MSLSLVEDETYIYVSYVDPQAANYEFIFYNGEDECHEERTCREGMELWLEGECELE